MNYIIFDLEWNNAYNYATKKGVNEIIEIGAVKLDKNLNIIDTFKQLVKPKIAKKLTNRCKKLTNISPEEIKEFGISFEDAMKDFKRWSDNGNCVFLSWSNSDLYVLADSFKRSYDNCVVDFMKKYCDAQKYCMAFINGSNSSNQIGLSKCADLFEISIDETKMHRALTDCYVTAECFKKVFDESKINDFVSECDTAFFERLTYKSFFINVPKFNTFNIANETAQCPECNSNLKIIKPFESVNNTFIGVGMCNKCNKKFWIYIRAKKTYDDIVVTNRVVPMNKKKSYKIDKVNQKTTK